MENLIYSGSDFTFSPNITQTYKLEVISDEDGFKDYNEVTVIVNENFIRSVVPNPGTDFIDVQYMISQSISAYLSIVNISNADTNNYILDSTGGILNINISSYSQGLYSISLVCDGEVKDSELLVIN